MHSIIERLSRGTGLRMSNVLHAAQHGSIDSHGAGLDYSLMPEHAICEYALQGQLAAQRIRKAFRICPLATVTTT